MEWKIDFVAMRAEECLTVLEILQDTEKYIVVRDNFHAVYATQLLRHQDNWNNTRDCMTENMSFRVILVVKYSALVETLKSMKEHILERSLFLVIFAERNFPRQVIAKGIRNLVIILKRKIWKYIRRCSLEKGLFLVMLFAGNLPRR